MRRGDWAYVRDEWSVAPSLAFTGEASGQSANDSLMRCFAMLRDRYRSELDSPSVQLESVREVEAFVQPWDKLVESHCFEEGVGEVANEKNGRQEGGGVPPSHASPQKEGESELESEGEAVTVEEEYRTFRPITYTAAVTVEDVHGNINVNRVRRQVTQLSAYQNASWQAIRMEYGLLPDVTILDQLIPAAPLLVRMRWQFDAMVHRLAQQCGKRPEEVACVHIDGDDFLGGSIERGQDTLVGGGMTKSAVEIRRFFFTARFVSDGCVVWQQNGPGRYRLEFDCYVQALTYLLDRHPDVGLMCFDTRGGGVLFPTSHLLELAVQRHDGYNIATNHRGKWNAYAILGTLTSQLIGSFYQTTYKEDRNTGETCAVLTVNDGRRSGQLLIQRQAKRRGEAWRNACLDALRENFPNQYRDALLLHPDIDLSSDTMARGSKYRALPREKRVEHIGNIFSLVAAFAEEDLGWYNLRIRLRNTSGDLGLPQWVAEMEAQVDGEEHRRIVATSPPYPQVRHARRVLLYTVAQKYFPKELEAYAKLNRGDAVNPDLDTHNSYNTVYRVGSDSFLNQVMGLLEECAPSMAPFTWMVEHSTVGDEGEVDAGNDGSVEWLLRPLRLRFRAVVYGQKGDLLISERVGDGDESAVSVLCSVLRAATDRLAGDKGEKLWTEYESHAPPAVATSRELSLYMFNAFFGSSSLTAAEGADVGPCAMEQQVVDIEAREVGGYWFATLSLTRAGCLTVARAVATTKREAVRDVLLLACRRSFQRSLAYLSAHSRETHSFASEILSLPVIEELPDNILRSIWQQLDRAEVTAPPRPYTLLHRCVARDLRNDRWLRVEQQPNGGSGFQCRIYLQKHRRVSKRGEVQLIGFGCAISRAQALHVASVRALENLFEEDLSDAIRRLPTYTDLPPLD
uniref:Uncharacterized protein n=1 Tax=Trypanosoma vivax (strain Y486) TaxID=1055687 RepID=G0TT69_TRYVY|nr:conserved hypothetical protein [Trypanosoma vivax Y486]